MAGDASTPAPKKDRIYGSKTNPKGSAASGKSRAVKFSDRTEASLKKKVQEHNEKAPKGRKATLGMLKAVYRRGAGAFSTSHRPGKTRDQWAMARVNAFLKLLKSGSPANPKYVSDNDLLPAAHPKSSKRSASVSGLTAAVSSCPPATQDIAINLKNRKNAIDVAMYGPLNPAEPNEEYWAKLGEEWSVSVEEAKKQRCGNCAVFVITPSMKSCISEGLSTGGDEFDAIDAAGELGYCEAFDFKCASARTCRAWVAGGPVSEERSASDLSLVASARLVPEERDLAEALLEVVEKHGKFNEDQIGVWAGYSKPEDNEVASIGVKCANCVFYRGGSECAIISLPVEPEGKCRFAVIPEGVVNDDAVVLYDRNNLEQDVDDLYYADELSIVLGDESDYSSPEEAILALTEYLGLGYEAEPAVRAAWIRGVNSGESPYQRAKSMAEYGYDSSDSDLLPYS